MKHRDVVSNFIFHQTKDKVALFRRSHHPDVHTYQGKFAPVAGSIEKGDSNAAAAATRELREETQLVVDKHLKPCFTGKPFSFKDEQAQRSWTVHPFSWKLEADETLIQTDWEHETWEWIDPQEIVSGKLRDDCVPRLESSFRRVYFGKDGIFGNIIAMTPESAAGKAFMAGIDKLRTDKKNGARMLATSAVECLKQIAQGLSESTMSPDEWWTALRLAAYHLVYSARPSMNSAISSAVLDALRRIDSGQPLSKAVEHFQTCMSERVDQSRKVSKTFTSMIQNGTPFDIREDHSSKEALNIVTLSSSSTILFALEDLIATTTCRINLYILESRPNLEGATLARQLLEKLESDFKRRLHITIAPDTHIAHVLHTLPKNEDVPSYLVLGADRISSSGHVSNKMGSLPAALCARHISPDTNTVVLSETDKIAKEVIKSSPGKQVTRDGGDEAIKSHAPESNDPSEVTRSWQSDDQSFFQEQADNDKTELSVDIQNIYFEWVPAELIGVYVSETGLLSRDDIMRIAAEKGDLEEKLLGKLCDDD